MTQDALFQTLLRLGDNTLVLGHRVSEWCGKAPVLEEDIALANTALDFIGQTQMWLGYAAEVEGKGRSADDLAFLRDVWDFRNILMVERPNLDFGHTMMRQFLFDAYHRALLAALSTSSDTRIAEIAAKSVKEATYHLERSAETVIALGDGTEVSHAKMQEALNLLWPYAGEMFEADATDQLMIDAGVLPDPMPLRAEWMEKVSQVMAEATLSIPEDDFAHKGGRSGARHTEHLGHMLTQMQWLQRAYPGANW
ncbi:1,2-phenylacetyl-CoA epoxidase subunit PaaC [Sulfitobacter donghicola]|uniref:Phenylacetic acid degradation protein n=1 Tax=Sulfitobacter donghicola DSW-25 = KCTC 12864 = JCM 14565 TaxID=1300350 RepID=A0A073IKJ1_9RHOB|nr:1,2-phenylacetyl-CoA epoxidase subunit PaaC [Sulfitobacter donghicola]KEJ90289.1 phenylacetic acid degradation protein [Sulfitobacter donghicola DSW-25 = KCTC 12864 = JCM 14565]KIN66537.1 Phenylacetic acid degradation protein PaaI [Sulfitobacter donghicola DSW-25 = KCTC 12864 = JCM 14565]